MSEPCEPCGADLSAVHGPVRVYTFWNVVGPFAQTRFEEATCLRCGAVTHRRLPQEFEPRDQRHPVDTAARVRVE